jgi:hypothetical protein
MGTSATIALAVPAAAGTLIITPCPSGSDIDQVRNHVAGVPSFHFLCQYWIQSHDYDSRRHYFLLAPDQRIFYTWRTCASGCGFAAWTSLGGTGYSFVGAANYVTTSGAKVLRVDVTGAGGNYCK